MTDSDAPLISICIPYYAGAGTIARCVGSIHSQKIEGLGCVMERGLVEVIVTSDDHSDEARDILGRLAAAFGIKVIFNQERLGLSGNWQAALAESRGEVVTLMHQDDWYNPGCLGAAWQHFRDEPKLAMLAFNAMLFSHGIGPQLDDDSGDWSGAEYRERLLELKGAYAPSVVFFRRTNLPADGRYYLPLYNWCPEVILYYNLAKAAPDARIRFDSRPLVARGLGADQYSQNNEDARVNDYVNLWKALAAEPGVDGAKVGTAVLRSLLKRAQNIQKNKSIANVQRGAVGFDYLMTLLEHPDIPALIEADPSALIELVPSMGRPGKLDSILLREAVMMSGVLERVSAEVAKSIESAIDEHFVPDPELRTLVLAGKERIQTSDSFLSPVIICGFHHSGTRLLAEMLEAVGVFQKTNSPTHEWTYIQALNTVVLPEWWSADAIDQFDEARGAEFLHHEVLAYRLAAAGYVDGPWGQKDPRDSVTVGAWLRAFPHARIVNLVRDPKDVIGTLPASYAAYTPGGKLPQNDVEWWARTWLAYLRRTRAAMQKAEHAIEVRFEDLCAEPVATIRAVVDALDLDCSVSAKDFASMSIKSGKVGVYRNWIAQGRLSQQSAAKLEDQMAGVLAKPWRAIRQKQLVEPEA